jgi:hypothetical protein
MLPKVVRSDSGTARGNWAAALGLRRKDGAGKGRTEATDGQIDALVYELYALTEDRNRGGGEQEKRVEASL